MLYQLIRDEILRTYEAAKKTYENIKFSLEEAYVVGSGDSYAAALIIQGVTNNKFIALDPYEAQFSIKPHKVYVVVSVSGKTRENIELAIKVRESGGKVIAITANPKSKLAQKASEIIPIDYSPPNLPIPGTLSFTLSLIALYALANLDVNFEKLKNPELKALKGLEPIFIGTLGGYGVAYYSALKFYEVFGSKARFERTEQFCHATIFSVRENDQVIFYPSDNDRRAREVAEAISEKYNLVIYDRCEKHMKHLCQIVDFQTSLAEYIKELGLEKPYFTIAKGVLDVSSNLIY